MNDKQNGLRSYLLLYCGSLILFKDSHEMFEDVGKKQQFIENNK